MRVKKKLLAAVLTAALACTCLPIQGIGMTNVFADEEVTEEFTIDENGVLTRYKGRGGDIVIPEGVTSIGDSAFFLCNSVTGITIPEGVISIGEYAFSDCKGLKSVTLSEGLRSIERGAFYNCNSLTSITIPEGVTNIDYGVFRGCSGLTSIIVDKNNSNYDSRENCNAIIETESNKLISGCKNTVIPGSVIAIDDYAFCGCSGLTNITIPEGVTSIGYYAFELCSSLTSIEIPSSVTSIGNDIFYNSSRLMSITVAEGNPNYDSRDNCNAIIEKKTNELRVGCQNTKIPSSVTSIGNGAFSGCSSLMSIEIPSSVMKIGDKAFSFCSCLISIEIPSSVTEIGYSAFEYCDYITIYGETDSAVETYAKQYNISFKVIGESTRPDEPAIQLSPGVNKLQDDYINYAYLNECRQIPNEKQEGIYFLNSRKLSFYSFNSGDINTIYVWNDVTDSYVANGKLYVLEVKENTVIYIYNLDSMELEKTIPVEFSASVIGADEQQRIYLAGGYRENTMVYLLSSDGELLSSSSAFDTIYDFIGFDSVTGDFYFECYYNWIYWGYDHDMQAVGAGNVSGNTISVSENLLQTIKHMDYNEGQREADLIGGRYLCVDAPVCVTGNLMNPSNSGLFVWDSNQSNVMEPSFVNVMVLSRSYVDAEDYGSSIGSRCVYNEKNDSIISYIDNDTLGEFIPGREDYIGTYQTAHPVFSLEKYNDCIFAFEKENDEYYLEIIDWKQPSTLKISADTSDMQVGADIQLSVTSDGTLTNNYIWESSDSQVASVTSEGKVFAWHEGTAEITVKTLGGASASYTVHVNKSDVEKNFTKELKLSGTVSDNISKNSYYTYGRVVNSYLIENADGTLTRLENVNGSIVIEVYNKDTGEMLNNKKADFELPLFGGFYNGADANYLVFGQPNEQEDDSAEVMRIVKYSKDWKHLSSASVYGANTDIPFEAGSLRMTETNGRLYIHTCHKMYESDDGLNHQANMTFVINESDMTIEDSCYDVGNIAQNGYVSHSFNQFIQADGDYIYRVDHGDAYPRAITLTRCRDGESIEDVAYTQPFLIGGDSGDNRTGVSVGGFQIGSDNCLIVGNSVQQENFNDTDGQRNIFLTLTNKTSFKTDIIWLTDYTDNKVEVGTPQLVKLGEDQFLLMWEEYVSSSNSLSTKAVTIDGCGNKTSDITRIGMSLSDCQPIVTSDGLVRWYQSDGSKVNLYTINPFTLELFSSFLLGDVDFDGKINLNDAKLLLKGAVGIITLTEEQQKAGDINNDQKINLNDAKMLLRIAVGIAN